VTIQDLDGTSHTAEVTASSLFEAVAQGLSALGKNEWVEGIEERFGFVKVSVADVRVEHQVKIADFTQPFPRLIHPTLARYADFPTNPQNLRLRAQAVNDKGRYHGCHRRIVRAKFSPGLA